MTTYSTGNPLGSSDPRDLYDNAENLDNFVNGAQPAYDDRLGQARKSWAGMEQDFADFLANSHYVGTGTDGAVEDYAAGIEVTAYNQIIRDGGEFWRAAADTELPYTTTGAGMPEGGAFVSVGDAVLRQDLSGNPSDGEGAALVSGATIYVGSVAELEALSLAEGSNIYLTQDGRAGQFVVKTGTPPSDPQKGIYIVLANGNYAMRRFDGITGSGGFSIEWFGASESATAAENSLALQGAHDLLPSLGGRIQVGGSYECSGGVTFTKRVTISGNGKDSSALIYTGASTFITNTFLSIDNITISGKSPDETKYFTPGSLCFSSSASINTNTVRLARFERIVENNGGFYYRFFATFCDRFSEFYYGNSNNLLFVGGRAEFFDKFITYYSGVGPISIIGSSLENYTTHLVRSEAGARASVNIDGVYIEGNPIAQDWVARGLLQDDSLSAVCFYGASTLTLKGGSYQQFGARFISGGFGTIKSTGNRLMNIGAADYYFKGSVEGSAEFADKLVPAGAFSIQYIEHDGPVPEGGIKITDPVTGADASLLPSWNIPALENGWANETGGPAAGYYKKDGEVFLRGNLSGTSATAGTIFTLPAGFEPATQLFFPVLARSVSGSVNEILYARVMTNGGVTLFDPATGTTLADPSDYRRVILNSIRFRAAYS